jgi:hypothetical protein
MARQSECEEQRKVDGDEEANSSVPTRPDVFGQAATLGQCLPNAAHPGGAARVHNRVVGALTSTLSETLDGLSK